MLSRRNQAGSGHGARNHSHASGTRLACYFYATFHVRWRPDPVPEEKTPPVSRYKKNRRNRRKQ